MQCRVYTTHRVAIERHAPKQQRVSLTWLDGQTVLTAGRQLCEASRQ